MAVNSVVDRVIENRSQYPIREDYSEEFYHNCSQQLLDATALIEMKEIQRKVCVGRLFSLDRLVRYRDR
jgi:hypothetical protein